MSKDHLILTCGFGPYEGLEIAIDESSDTVVLFINAALSPQRRTELVAERVGDACKVTYARVPMQRSDSGVGGEARGGL